MTSEGTLRAYAYCELEKALRYLYSTYNDCSRCVQISLLPHPCGCRGFLRERIDAVVTQLPTLGAYAFENKMDHEHRCVGRE